MYGIRRFNMKKTVRHICCLYCVTARDGSSWRSLFLPTSTTIGIRRSPAERTVLERRKTTVDTKFGPVEVKLCTHKGNTYCYPEYESVKAVCQETGQNYRRVYGEAEQAARKQNSQEEE